MFTLHYLNFDKLASLIEADLSVYFVSDTSVIVGISVTDKTPIITEVDKIVSNTSFSKMIYINATPEQIYVTGTLPHRAIESIADFCNGELYDLRVPTYMQTEAYNTLNRVVIDLDHRKITELVDSLTKQPELTERDGYYGTLGEKAFFALVEQGKAEEKDAYLNLYPIK